MKKNYVKEYKGHKVPEGATHWLVNGFAKWVDNKSISVIGCFQGATWKKCSHGMLRNAIPLPEAPQEWSGEGLPPVGVECIINITEDVWGLSDQELKLNGEKVSVISNVKNKQGFDVTVFEISDGGVFCFSSKLFRPIKTQQEKDREALFQHMRELQPVSTPAMNDVLDHYTHSLIDAGFTAPKAGE